LLNIQDLHTRYGSFLALKNLSLTVQKGEIVTLLGANGAGKTTLLKTISGLLKPYAGSLMFEGRRIDSLPPNEIVRLGIAHCPEGRKLFPDMTVRKNLQLGAFTRLKDKQGVDQSIKEVLELFPILRERARQAAGTLSGGEQQMLSMGRALMTNPKLFLLDEPSLGLAPLVVRALFQTIRDINEKGMTIFLVEQNASLALQVAHQGYVIENGRIVLADSSLNLLNNEKVKQAYLGA
jgi:branched-chain amino acid transport system ATP-binding protein